MYYFIGFVGKRKTYLQEKNLPNTSKAIAVFAELV